MSRRRGRAFTAWLTVLLVAVASLVGGGLWLANYLGTALAPGLSVGCTATVGGNSYRLAVDQTQNAALIAGISVRRGMPARAASIALATALQESKLRNIDYGDLDSVGLFQQRPSQEWGTVEEIMDPLYSTNAFYNELVRVVGYVDMPLNDAAQIVQRSGHPQAYAKHEALAKAFASALTGQSPGALNCTLPPVAADAPISGDAVEAALHAALGPLPLTSTREESSTVVRIQASDALGWAAAQWALAHASEMGVTRISFAGQSWDRNDNRDGKNVGWQASSTTLVPDVVTVSIADVAGQ